LDFLDRLRDDEYARQLKEWTRGGPDCFGAAVVEDSLPVGSACCIECGRKDLLVASTADGRRVLLEEGAGRWAIKNERARIVAEGGAYSDHNCRRGASE